MDTYEHRYEVIERCILGAGELLIIAYTAGNGFSLDGFCGDRNNT